MKKIFTITLLMLLIFSKAYAYEHEITLDFTDVNNNLITEIGSLDTMKIIGKVSTPVKARTSCKLYVAFYDGTKLAGLESKNITLFATSRPQTFNMTVPLDNVQSDYSAKAFLWDDNNLTMCDRAELSRYILSDVSLSGLYSIEENIKCKYKQSSDAEVLFEWYLSDAENGEYTKIDNANKQIYRTTVSDGGKWLRAKALCGNKSYTTQPRYIEPSWRAVRLTSMVSLEGDNSFETVNKTTPPENVFTVDGVDFILLDVTESESAKYLVMAKNTLGESVKFAANYGANAGAYSYNNLAHYLNNDFKEQGYIPKSMLDYADKNVTWKFENNWWYNNATGYCNYGAIAVPSVQEIKKYSNKIGLQDSGKIWWTRSCYAYAPDGNAIFAMPSDDKALGTSIYRHSYNSSNYLRPMLYLDEGFFENVPINLRTAGENIKKIIAEFSREKLSEIGYNAEDLEWLYDFAVIDGLCEPYQTVSSKNNAASYRWMISDTRDGSYTDVSTAESYQITAKDAEKWLKLCLNNSNYSEPRKIGSLRVNKKMGMLDENFEAALDTPTENVFSVDGTEYILLDSFLGSEQRYLVMAKNCMGEAVPYQALTNKIAGTPDYMNMAEYLNTEFREKGYISDKISAHISNSVVWQYENTYWDGIKDGFCNRGGIGIASLPEIMKYASKIGLREDGKNWWTRTAYGTYATDGNAIIAVSGNGSSLTTFGHAENNQYYIRPMFYLDEDFFKDVKLDYAGSAVKSKILNDYSLSELMAINGGAYSYEEINNVFFHEQATAQIKISILENKANVSLDVKTDKEYVVQILWNNTPIKSETKQSGGIFDIEATVPYGIGDLSVKVMCENEVIGSKILSGQVIAKPYTDNFLAEFSMHGYNGPFGNNMYSMLKNAGASVARTNIYWSNVEKTKGVYDMSEWDRFINNSLENNIEPIATFVYGNGLYSENGAAPADKTAVDAFVDYICEVVKRYPDLKYFEIWNEPNSNSFWSPSANLHDYTALVKISERAVKKINPNAVVISGAIADSRQEVLSKMYENGVYDYTDAISSHPYTYYYSQGVDDSYKTRIDRVKKISLQNGGWKADMITEMGFPTNKGSVSEEEERQAAELVKQYVVADSSDIEANLIYQLKDVGNDNKNPEHRFGVMNYDLTPKKAYLANTVLMDYIQGSYYMGELNLGENTKAYLYSRDGEPVLIAWGEDVPFDNCEAFDLYGNSLGTDFELTDEPCYITGLDKSYFQKAAANAIEKKIDEMLSWIGGDKELFADTIANAKALSGLDSLADSGVIKQYTDSHFAISQSINVSSKTQHSALLYIIEQTGKLWINLYAQTDAKIQNHNKLTTTAAYINSLKSGKIGASLPYSEAMLAAAKKYADMSERLAASDSYGNTKNAAIAAWNEMAGYICDMSAEFATSETPECTDIIIHVPKNQATLEYNKRSPLEVSIYNYSDTDINGAVLRIIDASGNTVGEECVSIAAGESILPSVDTLINDGGCDKSFVNAELVLDGNVIKRERIMPMKQLEKLSYVGEGEGVFKQYTDNADIFTVGGQDFILLDKTPDGKFFCMTKDTFGTVAYNSQNRQEFNADNPTSAAYWLNDTFYNELLTPSVRGFVDTEHYFTTEAGSQIGVSPFDSQTKCGIAVLSEDELMRYKDIIGIYDDNNPNIAIWKQMLRTPDTRIDMTHLIKTIQVRKENGSCYFSTVHYEANYKCYVRPVFYLEADFFDRVECDFIGENVMKKCK